MSIKASISILKAHLSRYLDMVKAGEEVLVTERGRPVAKLSPLAPNRDPEGRVAKLVREGRLRPPLEPLGADFLAQDRPADPEGRSLDTLLEERRAGR